MECVICKRPLQTGKVVNVKVQGLKTLAAASVLRKDGLDDIFSEKVNKEEVLILHESCR